MKAIASTLASKLTLILSAIAIGGVLAFGSVTARSEHSDAIKPVDPVAGSEISATDQNDELEAKKKPGKKKKEKGGKHKNKKGGKSGK